MEQPKRPPNLLEGASRWDKLTFSWVMPMLRKGLENSDLSEIDLPELAEKETSEYNLDMMNVIWNDERKHATAGNRTPNLKWAVLKRVLAKLWFIQPMMLSMSLARIGQALALGRLIDFFEGTSTRAEGYTYASVLVVCGLVTLFFNHHTFYHTWKTGMQLRIAAIASIYSKTLRLGSVFSSDKTNSGQIMNLASNDVERFILSTVFLSHLFWGPMEAIAVLIVGIFTIGPAFAAGYALLFIFIPIQFYLGTKFVHFRGKIAGITDERVTMISQAVAGIRVVKMMGWELAFVEKIRKIRQRETDEIQKATKLKAWNEAIFFATNLTVSAIIFLVHVLTGHTLNPRDVFTTFTLLNIVQLTMTKFFAFGIMAVSEVSVSIDRIQIFLEREEIGFTKSTTVENSEYCLKLDRVTCYWNTPAHDSADGDNAKQVAVDMMPAESANGAIAVENISLEFKKGNMYCIIGAVGSGKSALIQTICGELQASSGHISKSLYSMAYATQDPFIMDGTVKDNILFGLTYDKTWYEEVVNACGLNVDFKQFQNGDGTIVGDRGVQCSGGQRARMGLARALYRKADVLVADDPLSAVDAHVGNLLFHEALERLAVGQGSCVILATHQHQYLKQHTCILMEEGKIVRLGPYAECSKLLQEDSQQHQDGDEKGASSKVTRIEGNDEVQQESPENSKSLNKADQNEQKNAGKVDFSTWKNYARSMGGLHIGCALLLLYAISQTVVLVGVAEFGRWAEKSKEDQSSTQTISLISGLTGAVIILSVVRAYAVFHFAIKASQRLHDEMIMVVLRSKIEFFDTNPLGRILNRFSADVGSNDDALPHTMYDFFACIFMVVGAVFTAGVILPYTLITIPFLGWYFGRVRHIFLTSSRELKRLEALARSPIFAMLSESLNGISTIRSNGAIDFYRQKFQHVHDSHSRAFFMFIASSRWLGFRMDGLVFMLLSVSSFLAVLFQDRGWFKVDPALVGLALTLLIMLAGLFQWTVRQSAEIVNQMISVERVNSYTTLTPEAPLKTEEDDKHPDWPLHGNITCSDLTVRYRADLPPALKNISFHAAGGERIGCVGRTGSGKSSLIQTLVRILESEAGDISVDGVNLTTLGLHKIRHNISVIPQSPVLFSGSTVKDNIDPFHQYTDDLIKKALEDVQMWKVVDALPDGLNAMVAENGSNFSVGQRQLLCLARAILRQTKILVLDEPSANVDNDTDILLQEAVAENFKHSTIIAVAHRLDTVIDYDKILVLGGGQVLEFDTPHNLIEKDESFAQMVSDTGNRKSAALRQRASIQSSELTLSST